MTSYTLARAYAAVAVVAVLLAVVWPLDGYGWRVSVAYLLLAGVSVYACRRNVRAVRRRKLRARAQRVTEYRVYAPDVWIIADPANDPAATDWVRWRDHGIRRFAVSATEAP